MKHFRRFFSHGRNWLAAFLVLLFVFVAVAAPLLSPNDPKRPGPFKIVGRPTEGMPQPPNAAAPLGTLPFSISVYHALVWGTRDAIRFGLLVTLSVACIGIIYGAVAGYAGGVVNRSMMRVADAFLAFPVIAAVVLIRQIYLNALSFTNGSQTTALPFIQSVLNRIDPLTLSLILFCWMPYARLVNTLVIELKKTEFILAARSIGGRPARILFRHLLPNAISPTVVLAARDVGSFVILQATLTFIRIDGNSIWGVILVNGRDWIIGPGGNVMAYWWVFLPATLAVILFGITWNLLGDGLSELLDPFNRYR